MENCSMQPSSNLIKYSHLKRHPNHSFLSIKKNSTIKGAILPKPLSFMRFQYIMTSKYILLLLSAHMFYCCILYFYSILVSSEIESVSVWSESFRSRLFCPIIQLIHVARNNVIDASTADVGIASQA